ncbi:MAG: CRISPR-associated protein Cas5 [Candidatus Bathyarchaeia archaeon]
MLWIGAKYHFASTFSYRIPNFSSSYALAAPVPSPSTVKLALISETISRSGDVSKGKMLFEYLRDANVAIEIPSRIAAFKCFIKRLKQKRQGKGFDLTFGIREYLVYSDPLNILLEIPDHSLNDIEKSLKTISHFGTSDSLCTCIEIINREPLWDKCPKVYSAGDKKGIIFLLTDFTNKVAFDNVNPYSGVRMIKDKHIITKPYLFPLHLLAKESNYTIFENISH